MERLLATILVTLSVASGCAMQDEFSEAKARAASAMKDPASTQFRNLHYGVEPGTVCGEINAKNGFGGYVGFERFFIADGSASPFIASSAEASIAGSDMDESQLALLRRNMNLEIDKACDKNVAGAIKVEAERMARAAAERERANKRKPGSE